MKNILGMLLLTSLTTAAYAQDPVISGNDYLQSSTKCFTGKADPNASTDMNNPMDMNSPMNMNNGTLGETFDWNSDFNKANPENSNICRHGAAFNNTAQRSKKGISHGWDKVKHNKLTKHLFNQPPIANNWSNK